MRRHYAPTVLALAWLAAACARDELLSVDPGSAPGTSAQTVQAVIDLAGFAGWIDTTFTGFSSAADACRAPGRYLQIETGSPDLTSHGLMRFSKTGQAVFPDTIIFGDTVSAVLAFDSGRVVLTVDSAQSAFLDTGSTVQLLAVEENWDGESADWTFAVDSVGVQVAWSVPGGTFGAVVSDTVVTAADDSVVLSLGAATDSILESWSDTTQTNTGLGVVVADSGVLVGLAPRLLYQAIPEADPDTSVEVVPVTPSACTFIFDPPSTPLPSGVLRVGGVTGWRVYAELLIPDSVSATGSDEFVPVLGGTVSFAEFVLISLNAPPPPFGATRSFTMSAFALGDDPRIYGAKTPVVDLIPGSETLINVDSLALGSPIIIDMTETIQRLINTQFVDSVPPLRFMLRATPEAATFGYWQFGASDGDPAFAPALNIVFTPPTDFGVP